MRKERTQRHEKSTPTAKPPPATSGKPEPGESHSKHNAGWKAERMAQTAAKPPSDSMSIRTPVGQPHNRATGRHGTPTPDLMPGRPGDREPGGRRHEDEQHRHDDAHEV